MSENAIAILNLLYRYAESIDTGDLSGAAALLRHKYPNLTGSQAASILLLTGNKDINNDGSDDFTGVSSTYGHGKLDLNQAMSPIGSLAIQ